MNKNQTIFILSRLVVRKFLAKNERLYYNITTDEFMSEAQAKHWIKKNNRILSEKTFVLGNIDDYKKFSITARKFHKIPHEKYVYYIIALKSLNKSNESVIVKIEGEKFDLISKVKAKKLYEKKKVVKILREHQSSFQKITLRSGIYDGIWVLLDELPHVKNPTFTLTNNASWLYPVLYKASIEYKEFRRTLSFVSNKLNLKYMESNVLKRKNMSLKLSLDTNTTRVRIRRKGGVVIQDCDVYVGRKCSMGGWELKDHELRNIYRVGKGDDKYTLKESLRLYEKLMRERLKDDFNKWSQLILELEDKTLGCFCELTQGCHVDVIIKLLMELKSQGCELTMSNKKSGGKKSGKRTKTNKIEILGTDPETMIKILELGLEGEVNATEKQRLKLKEYGIKLPSIRVGGQRRAMSYPDKEGYEQISAWSRGKTPWKELSPFFIGPVIFSQNDKPEKARLFENFWQAHKVWEFVEKQKQKNWKWSKEYHVEFVTSDEIEIEVTDEWHEWRKALMKNKSAVRRPNGRNIPLYTLWNGQRLDIVEARKQIYIPHYQVLLRQSKVYHKLLNMVRKGKKIIIIEPDGPDPKLYPSGRLTNLKILRDWVEVTHKKDVNEGKGYRAYGHGYVIAKTLWEDLLDYYRLKILYNM